MASNGTASGREYTNNSASHLAALVPLVALFELMEQWTGRMVATRDLETVQDNDPVEGNKRLGVSAPERRLCFGMHLTYPPMDADPPPTDGAAGIEKRPAPQRRALVAATAKKTIVNHCAQELFALYMFAIAAETEHICGRTTRLSLSQGSLRVWDNSFLTSLAVEAVRANLASDLHEAFALVIPAVVHFNLLPTEESETSRG